MNEIHARIVIRDRETGTVIREIGEASHAIVDPGEDVQSVHGWRNYVAERVSLAVKATVASELTREAVLAKLPKIAGYCPRCGDELEQGAEILPDPEADGKPAHVACLAGGKEKDDATGKTPADDAGGAAPEGGAAGAAEGGGEAGAAGAVHPSEEVIELGRSAAGDPGADPGSSGEAHAGSEGAEGGDAGGGEVSRRRGRRSGSS